MVGRVEPGHLNLTPAPLARTGVPSASPAGSCVPSPPVPPGQYSGSVITAENYRISTTCVIRESTAAPGAPEPGGRSESPLRRTRTLSARRGSVTRAAPPPRRLAEASSREVDDHRAHHPRGPAHEVHARFSTSPERASARRTNDSWTRALVSSSVCRLCARSRAPESRRRSVYVAAYSASVASGSPRLSPMDQLGQGERHIHACHHLTSDASLQGVTEVVRVTIRATACRGPRRAQPETILHRRRRPR